MSGAPSHALSALLAQHDALREWMASCDRLMVRLEDGQSVEAELARVVADLRVALDAHNVYEESLLRPLLVEADAFGPVRIDRMIADHVGEHRAIHDGLTVEPSVAILRGVLATLRAHLAEEERYFLSSSVLHDDLVSLESTG